MHRGALRREWVPQLVGVGARTVCNSFEILKKRDKFSKRLLEKSQKQEDLSQMEYSIKLFPNKESLLRIATALLSELDETWLAESKRYI